MFSSITAYCKIKMMHLKPRLVSDSDVEVNLPESNMVIVLN